MYYAILHTCDPKDRATYLMARTRSEAVKMARDYVLRTLKSADVAKVRREDNGYEWPDSARTTYYVRGSDGKIMRRNARKAC